MALLFSLIGSSFVLFIRSALLLFLLMVRPAMNFILRMLVVAWKGNYINKQNPDNEARSKVSTGFLSYGVFMLFRCPVHNKKKKNGWNDAALESFCLRRKGRCVSIMLSVLQRWISLVFQSGDCSSRIVCFDRLCQRPFYNNCRCSRALCG